MDPRRPAPEEMLERAEREAKRARRGALKIYFGAAPGVGKTYAMLEGARALARDGVDVVIGWVETHGRRETDVLAEGLERLAPRIVDYRGVRLREFDLDAALARRPKVLLLDELAHTNAAGSRHARRWQDVEELVESGIDVHTTVNVQHIESLNDVVGRITGVRVRETVPDLLFERADEIELVDLPPDDLLKRLREGRVYVPLQAELAAQHFFRKGNLLALRELALRRTAERVDAQTAEWRRDHGVLEPWSASERVLVFVDPEASAADVVRAGYRISARARAPWIALSIETPEVERLAPRPREQLGAALDLAERLGAEPLVVRGEDVADEILAVARERRVTRIVLGRPAGTWLTWLRRARVAANVLLRAQAIDVIVTSGEPTGEAATAMAPRKRESVAAGHYAWALSVVVLSTVVCWLTGSYLTLADVAMIYLLGVLVVASRFPRLPSLAAAIASVAAFDFCFVPPYFTFAVRDFRYIITFGVMLAVASTVSSFTVRLREQAEAARQRERRTAALYAMSRQFVVETGVGAIAATAIRHVREFMETEAFVLLADRAGNLSPCGGEGAWVVEYERELAVARWVHAHGRLAGFGTDTLPAAECLYIPLVGTAGHIGVFGVALARRNITPSPFQWQTLETFVAQTALALERALLVERSALAQVSMETERARSELLSAVTHDVRTPLTAISGSAQTLIAAGEDLASDRRRELLATIRDESDRLSRIVGDLLDLTRLESGALRVRKEPCPVDDVIDSALARLDERLASREVEREVPDEVLVVPLDATLFEQVLLNLLENAAKYSPAGSPISVRVQRRGDEAVFEIADRGPGIPAAERERVFERFYRAGDGQRASGTGLGLTVSRAIVRAHGGTISAEDRPGGGALFRVRVPMNDATGQSPASKIEPSS